MPLLAFLLLLLLPAASVAYSAEALMRGGMIGIDFAVFQHDITALNASLASEGYPALNDWLVCTGGGGGFVYKGFYLGGRGFGSLAQEVRNTAHSVSYHAGFGLFDIGYVAIFLPNFYLIPMLSVGGGGLSLGISPLYVSDNSFSNLVRTPERQTLLQYDALMLGISALAALHFVSWDIEITAGWYYYPSDGMRFNGTVLSASPTMPKYLLFLSAGFRIGRITVDASE